MSVGYGLINQRQIIDFVTSACDLLGHGSKNNAVEMLLETCAQETSLGSIHDRTPNTHGVGVCQMDLIAFDDVVARTRGNDRDLIEIAYGIDISDVQHCQLAYSPLLSVIFCRLFYKLIPEVFPNTVAARAEYWKRYYNTVAGRGTAAQYIKNAELFC